MSKSVEVNMILGAVFMIALFRIGILGGIPLGMPEWLVYVTLIIAGAFVGKLVHPSSYISK
jgi:hypothetical protein